MNYDLAKELKDARFPQGGKGTWTYPMDALVAKSSDRVYAPTLEELIEACGEEFAELEHIEANIGNWQFVARSNHGSLPGMVGNTPTEAVARLWLALHPKQHGN